MPIAGSCYAKFSMPASATRSESEPILNSCPSCQQLIDVTSLEPYSKIVCQNCQDTIRVRTHFHHFQIREQIGIGGMSRVFRATDTALKRDVALKILHRQFSADAHRVGQFEREARITAAISHPNVVKVYSSGWDQGYFYIAMELVRGGSLDEKIRKEHRLPEKDVLEIAIQTARGLKAAQQAGLIHRDIKPGNILFADDGTAKIVDFGLALMQSDKDTEKELWATPYYVPPEKLDGGAEDHRSDIYSLGASLFHAVLGRPPCSSDTNSLEELRALKSQTVNLTDEDSIHVSQETTSLLECCLQKKAEDRYESYDDFIKHAEFAQAHPGKKKSRSRRRKASQTKLIAALIAAAALGGGVTAMLKKSPPPVIDDSGLQIESDPTASDNKTVSSQFSAARDALFRGELPEARGEFTSLSATAPQPTANWATYNAGLCALLQGDDVAAGEIFSTLEVIATDPMAPFFSKIKKTLTDRLPTPADVAMEFDSSTFAAMGLLANGLKNWQLGDWQLARPFLEKFHAAAPTGSSAWVKNYQPLIAPHISDLKLLKDLKPLKLEGIDGTEASGRLKIARNIAASLHLPGAAKASLEKEVQRFSGEVETLLTKEKEEARKADEELMQKETGALTELLAQAATAAEGLKFPVAIQLLKQAKFKSTNINEQLEDQITLWQGAEDFLEQLAKDLSQPGEEIELSKIDSSPMRGHILGASRDGIRFQVSRINGESLIPFNSVQPAQLIRWAEQPLEEEKITDSDEYYHRRELIVAFALRSRQTAYGTLRGNQLARENRAFGDRWKRVQSQLKL